MLVAVALAVVGAACGGSSGQDRPQDCRASEFFNESTKRCTPCPAVTPPDCPDGCGWEVYERDSGCAAARCAPNCRFCEVGKRYDEETGLCERCPGAPNCQELSCDGELRAKGSYAGPCPEPSAFACGQCSDPKSGCAVGDNGQCVDSEDSSE
ncbi:MAG: hypothetical protein ABEN55_10300 [Bradymonadaceae bacterium]